VDEIPDTPEAGDVPDVGTTSATSSSI